MCALPRSPRCRVTECVQGEDNVSSTSSQLELDPRKTAAAQREIAELHKGAKKGVKEDDLDHVRLALRCAACLRLSLSTGRVQEEDPGNLVHV